ncbi:tetratricopeptide repeat protein [Niveibacterium terrae]|uniref:tetratricopeptide repeat protein n=1 Tax=Niveibacterium terrae TaxID=3373598 RepID=UPI003A94C719
MNRNSRIPHQKAAPSKQINAQFQSGCGLFEAGQFDRALAAFQAILARDPRHFDALNRAAACHRLLAQPVEAEALWKRAIALQPGNASVHNNLGVLLFNLARHGESEKELARAIALRETYPEAHFNLGQLFVAMDRPIEAEAQFRCALEQQPGNALYRDALGALLHGARRFAESEAELRLAASLAPDFPEAHLHLGKTLLAQDKTDEAETALMRAAELRPACFEVNYTLARLYADSLRIREAETHYRRALAANPAHIDTRLSLALLLLSTGRLEEGLPLYEVRREKDLYKNADKFPFQDWHGEDLHEKSIVVCPEQGLGDQILCLRFLPLLRARGARRISVVCSSSLKPLFSSTPDADLILSQEDAAQGIALHDYRVLAFSLPLLLQLTLTTIPGTDPYLSADPGRTAKWPSLLCGEEMRIGLVWRGSAQHANDANRSLSSLAELAPLWALPGLKFFSLQKGDGEAEALQPPTNQPIVALGQDIMDFADTAAIIDQLDLLICVDTSIAHLAGALGKPCWVMLPAIDTDWRWFRDRSDTPWYRSLKLFRQGTPGDWTKAVAAISAELSALTLQRRSNPPV